LYRLLRVIVPDWFQRIVIPAPGWTTNGDTVLQLRRLRKIAEETKNHDLERDLYIEERKAERGIQLAHRLASLGRGLLLRGVNRSRFHFSMHVVFAPWLYLWTAGRNILGVTAHITWIGVMFVYWALADYGRSWVRPLTMLVTSVFLFHAAYLQLLDPAIRSAQTRGERATAAVRKAVVFNGSNDSAFYRAARLFSVAHALPFVGALTLDKDVQATLLCGALLPDPRATPKDDVGVCATVPLPSVRFQLLVLTQSVFSAICVFFISLALRNYFRLR